MLYTTTRALKYGIALSACAIIALCTLYVTRPTAQSNASPIYGVTIPAGYRDWKLIAVANLATDKIDSRAPNSATRKRSRPLRRGKSLSRTAQSLPRCIGIVSGRKTTTKSWPVPSPALNLSSSGLPQMFSLWSRTQKGTLRRAAGGSLISRMENLATRHCTKPASPATSLPKLTTMFSLITHLRPEGSTLHELLQRSSRAVAAVQESGRGPFRRS